LEKELVLVLDFGGQYNQLTARRVRELSVYSEMLPYDSSLEEIQGKNPKAIILTGGPASTYQENAPCCDPGIFELGVPVLGIGYGMQLMAFMLGGEIEGSPACEYGYSQLQILEPELLFSGMPDDIQVWLNHGDIIKKAPEEFTVSAKSDNVPIIAMSSPARRFFAVQFHTEAQKNTCGIEVLKNFLFNVTGLRGDWQMSDFIADTITSIKEKVGGKKVLCGLSGGVDSSVAAALVHKAVGDQLVCVYVDNGLMRKGESEEVIKTFQEQMKMNLVYVPAAERFLKHLQGVTDPEHKRKIIGEEFIRVFEEEKAKLGEIDYLVQGTIYSDIVESGTRTAPTIKSHHNVGGLPEDMDFKLIEPLRLLFKDEVRIIGEKLNIPPEIVWRQPFPGPGLGVRVLEEVTREKVDILREADAIVREEIKKAGLERDIWQAFAVLPPVRSVGVKDGARTYAYPIIIRAVISDDAMTAEIARLPWELLEKMARRIVAEVDGVNRVAYDITSKPPGTIEWE
jgi:GMP synthase (glutamine-hydrolysing)